MKQDFKEWRFRKNTEPV